VYHLNIREYYFLIYLIIKCYQYLPKKSVINIKIEDKIPIVKLKIIVLLVCIQWWK